MGNVSKIKADPKPEKIEKPTGLALMRQPFPDSAISKLPKPTKAQTEEVRADFKKGIRCAVCGGWHHPKVVHLDYVGHAALTDRLLECDPNWNWEPTAWTETGAPVTDAVGGMWIKLTVCGVTRLGYGHPDGKEGGDATKETIGDALRNAAMRFGAALDLWHKGELHPKDDQGDSQPAGGDSESVPKFNADAASQRIAKRLGKSETLAELAASWAEEKDTIKKIRDTSDNIFKELVEAKDAVKKRLEAEASIVSDDEIPY